MSEVVVSSESLDLLKKIMSRGYNLARLGSLGDRFIRTKQLPHDSDISTLFMSMEMLLDRLARK
jgi:hypothetical protein